jgi:hypothetical protein
MICICLVGERARRSLVAALLAMAMATILAACGGKSKPLVPTATVPQGTTTTNPYAVPEVIDEAYVNRVLAGLDEALGDVLRMVMANRTISNESADRLEALYVGDYYTLTLSGLQNALLDHFQGYKDNPGNQVTTAVELITSSPKCIFVRTSRDFSAINTQDRPPSAPWVGLIPTDPLRDRYHYNPTGWMYVLDGFSSDHTQPENPCDALS